MNGLNDFLIRGLMNLIPLVLSLTVHEYAHALAAWKLGDDTAARMGRLSLNPLDHIDPIGTLLLPIMGIGFGWAKPVPTQPTHFTRRFSMRTGSAIVAMAGPASNLLIAIVATVVWALLVRFAPETLASQGGLHALLRIVIAMNVSLAVFNLLPIPPLDGHWIVENYLPSRLEPLWDSIKPYGMYLLLGIVYLGAGIVAIPSNILLHYVDRLAMFIIGA